jgi:hypothetical protein
MGNMTTCLSVPAVLVEALPGLACGINAYIYRIKKEAASKSMMQPLFIRDLMESGSHLSDSQDAHFFLIRPLQYAGRMPVIVAIRFSG